MDNEVLLKIKENHQKILNNTNKLKEKLKKQGKTFNDLHDKLFDNVIDKEPINIKNAPYEYIETNQEIIEENAENEVI